MVKQLNSSNVHLFWKFHKPWWIGVWQNFGMVSEISVRFTNGLTCVLGEMSVSTQKWIHCSSVPCETWFLEIELIRRWLAFDYKCLHGVICAWWNHWVLSAKVRRRVQVKNERSMDKFVKFRLSWFRHIMHAYPSPTSTGNDVVRSRLEEELCTIKPKQDISLWSHWLLDLIM